LKGFGVTAESSLTRSQRAAADLIWDFMARDEQRKELRTRQTPILVFAGPRGSGKSTIFRRFPGLLPSDEVDRGTRGRRFPCACVDGEWKLESAREMLALFAYELADSAKGALLTHRLATGLIVLEADLELPQTDRDASREEISSLLAEYRRIKGSLGEALGAVIRATVQTGANAAKALGIPVPDGVESAASEYFSQNVTSLLLGKMADTPKGRDLLLGKGQKWFHEQDPRQRDALDVLIALKRADVRARKGDVDAGREVTEMLWSAFLADLREAFAGKKSGTWSRNAVLLLDNADTPVAQSFLYDLVAARKRREGERRERTQGEQREPVEPDPLTVVVSSRGGLAKLADLTPLAEAGRADYLSKVSAGSSTWWYPVQLPAWDWAETRECVDALDLAGIDGAAITTAVHAFTGGNPHAIWLVLRALGELPQTTADADLLLTLLGAPEPGMPEESRRTVEEAIVARQLLSLPSDDPAFAEDLATCAAARHREAALRLATDSGLVEQLPGNDMRIFSHEFWIDSPAGPAVMPPLLRRLLLRRLASRVGPWAEVHLWLRDRAVRDKNQAAELFHTLSLTGTPQNLSAELAGGISPLEQVVEQLAKRLESDARAWLSLVADVTTAPRLLIRPQELRKQVSELTDWARRRDPRIAAVTRLVVCRWLGGDALSAPRWEWLLGEMAGELERLSTFSDDEGLSVLREEAQRYRAIAGGIWRDKEDFWMLRPGTSAQTYGGTRR
jgi:hypothetical protein